VQSVRDSDIAWTAPGANHNGIQLEHAGRAGQSSRDWGDPYSSAMLRRSAELCAELCRKYEIPATWLNASDLLAGRRGITTHAAVSEAFKRSTHWDPGRSFPAVEYLGMVRAAMSIVEILRRREGYYAWLAWYEGRDDWRKFGPRNPRVRPNVSKKIGAAWWARRLVFLARQKGAA